jgi:hypothetical protein
MGRIDSLEEAVRNTRCVGAVNTVVARLQDDKNGTTPGQEALLPTRDDFETAGFIRADFMLQDQEFDNEESMPRIVSAFAADEVTRNIQASIGRLQRTARALRNGVIEGYAFEEQLKKSLCEAANPGRHLSLSGVDGRSQQLQVDRFTTCDKSNLEEKIKEYWMKPNTWIFVAGQQGAFDAVHIQSPTHLRFVQATVGQKHTFYLDVINLLPQRLAVLNVWSHIEFLLLRPSDEQERPFVLDPARGSFRITNVLMRQIGIKEIIEEVLFTISLIGQIIYSPLLIPMKSAENSWSEDFRSAPTWTLLRLRHGTLAMCRFGQYIPSGIK